MKIVVFSDLDATLLDEETYSWKPAEKAIEALRKRDASLVMVTSKTLSEVTPLHEELGFDDPFVFENGGGVAFQTDTPLAEHLFSTPSEIMEFRKKAFAVLAFGKRHELLVTSLSEISAEVGVSLIGFSGLSLQDVSRITRLPTEQAARARQRMFDEPFLIPEGSAALEEAIRDAALRRGLDVVKGGRFWHLIGHAGKGNAVAVLLDAFHKRYGEVVSIGLGDSANDFPFLDRVNLPIILGALSHAEAGQPLPERAHRYPVPGPEGWNQAVLDILSTLWQPARLLTNATYGKE